MPSSWAVAAAQRILLHLDVEDFPNPLADIIDRSYAIGNPLVACGECGGRFTEDRVSPESSHPESPAVCDSCLATTAMVRELKMEREAHKSARTLLQRYRECRRFGVGMPQLNGDRIYLDDDVDAFLGDGPENITFLDGLAQTPASGIEALREIASRKTDDPVLANLIAGIRHGLELADRKKEETIL